MVPAYRKRESFLHSLHPLAQITLAISLAALALLADNPLTLVSVILSAALLASAAGVFSEWASWWKLCAVMGLAALIINPLVSREGATVIWMGPRLPVFGRLTVSLEAIAFGAGMALRLAAVIWALALLTLIMDPDRALGLLRGRGSRSALVSALSLRMVPTAMRDAGDILDAQRSRGIARDSGGRWKVLKSRMPLVRCLVVTSLDRAIALAEAMESRAYGSGRRTRFFSYRFGPDGWFVALVALAVLGVGIAGAVTGYTSFDYYPVIAWGGTAGSLVFAALPLLLAATVLALSWTWGKWDWLRLRT